MKRRLDKPPPAPKTHRRVAFRVYFQWEDGADVVRDSCVTHRVTSRESAAAEVRNGVMRGLPGLKVVDVEETVQTVSYIGVGGIGWFAHTDPPQRTDWH